MVRLPIYWTLACGMLSCDWCWQFMTYARPAAAKIAVPPLEKLMKKTLFTAVVAASTALFSIGCDVEQTEPGRMPDVDVDVEPGNMPEVDVDTPEVDLETEEKTVTTPEVDVSTEESTIEVPTGLDVDLPEDN